MTARGPVVIDWANAANGPGQADVALMYVIGATSRIDGPRPARPLVRLFRRRFLAAFLRSAADEDFRRVLPAVAAFRMRDPNVTADERAAVEALLAGTRVTLKG